MPSQPSRTTQKQMGRQYLSSVLGLAVLLIVASRIGGAVESGGSLRDGAGSQGREYADAVRIKTFTLDNGLEVMTIPIFGLDAVTYDNGMQIITSPLPASSNTLFMVWYKVGAADDPAGKSGLAHLVEHATVRATGAHTEAQGTPRPTPDGDVEAGAFTSHDYTAYIYVVPTKRLETVMRTESRRIVNLILTNEILASERKEIHVEWHEQVGDIPQMSFDEQMQAALYGTHTYGVPVLGWFPEMQRLNVDDVNNFYQAWYAPNNAILIVAGEITAAQLKPLVQLYFGSIPSRPTPIRHRPRVRNFNEGRRLVLKDAHVCEPLWKRMYLAPSYQAGDTKQVYALQVFAELLARGPTGYLFHHLVAEEKLATDIGIDYMPDSLGLTAFTLYAIPASGVTVDVLEQAIDRELAAMLAGRISPADVTRAQQHIQGEMAFVPRQIGAAAEKLGVALTTGRTLTDVVQWRARIDAVTQEQVQTAARSVLRAERSVTGTLLPAPDGDAGAGCVAELLTDNP